MNADMDVALADYRPAVGEFLATARQAHPPGWAAARTDGAWHARHHLAQLVARAAAEQAVATP